MSHVRSGSFFVRVNVKPILAIRAPAALNVAADTGWDTDCLQHERLWSPKWRILLFEDGNKKHPINHYVVLVVDFCV